MPTLKSQLQSLRNEDPSAVFIVRGINKLGFKSADLLTWYFSRFGKVKLTYVSHSRMKTTTRCGRMGDQGSQAKTGWRLRAAALAFVVMESADVTARILRNGPEYEVPTTPVCGRVVTVHPFHPHGDGDDEPLQDREAQGMADETELLGLITDEE